MEKDSLIPAFSRDRKPSFRSGDRKRFLDTRWILDTRSDLGDAGCWDESSRRNCSPSLTFRSNTSKGRSSLGFGLLAATTSILLLEPCLLICSWGTPCRLKLHGSCLLRAGKVVIPNNLQHNLIMIFICCAKVQITFVIRNNFGDSIYLPVPSLAPGLVQG